MLISFNYRYIMNTFVLLYVESKLSLWLILVIALQLTCYMSETLGQTASELTRLGQKHPRYTAKLNKPYYHYDFFIIIIICYYHNLRRSQRFPWQFPLLPSFSMPLLYRGKLPQEPLWAAEVRGAYHVLNIVWIVCRNHPCVCLNDAKWTPTNETF